MTTIEFSLPIDTLESIGLDAERLAGLLSCLFGDVKVFERDPDADTDAPFGPLMDFLFDNRKDSAPAHDAVPDFDNLAMCCRRLMLINELMGSMPEDAGLTEDEQDIVENIGCFHNDAASALAKAVDWNRRHPIEMNNIPD